MSAFTLQPLHEKDRSWVAEFIREQWGSAVVVSRGRVHRPDSLPGFIAWDKDRPVGLVTYHLKGEACELVSLNSLAEGQGVGAALVQAVEAAARTAGCRRLWLITTNDNTPALRWYQKRGFRLASLHAGAIEHSRMIKPQIPLTGLDGIPIRDEIELEILFD